MKNCEWGKEIMVQQVSFKSHICVCIENYLELEVTTMTCVAGPQVTASTVNTRHHGKTVTLQHKETDTPAPSLTVAETLICSRFCFTELVPGQERARLRSPQNYTCRRDRAGRTRRRTFSNVQVEEVAV